MVKRQRYLIKVRQKLTYASYLAWFWYIHGSNGKIILRSNNYFNKTQCVNVARKLSQFTGIKMEVLK